MGGLTAVIAAAGNYRCLQNDLMIMGTACRAGVSLMLLGGSVKLSAGLNITPPKIIDNLPKT